MNELCPSFQWQQLAERSKSFPRRAAEVCADLQKEVDSRQDSIKEHEQHPHEGVDFSCLWNSTAWFIFRV